MQRNKTIDRNTIVFWKNKAIDWLNDCNPQVINSFITYYLRSFYGNLLFLGLFFDIFRNV